MARACAGVLSSRAKLNLISKNSSRVRMLTCPTALPPRLQCHRRAAAAQELVGASWLPPNFKVSAADDGD